jgi:hypothetical protein
VRPRILAYLGLKRPRRARTHLVSLCRISQLLPDLAHVAGIIAPGCTTGVFLPYSYIALGVTACRWNSWRTLNLGKIRCGSLGRARLKSRLHLWGWLGSTPEGRRPQIRGFRTGGSPAVASSTPATQRLSPTRMLKLNRAVGLNQEKHELTKKQPKPPTVYVIAGPNGYRVVLFFLWLPNADMAVARVENRVKEGGHDVPAEDVRRRYQAGVRNFFRLYRPILNSWWLYDSSGLPPKLIAVEGDGQLVVKQKRLYRRIEQQSAEYHEESN